MKKKILEKLKTKFMGVSDTILDRVASNLAKTVTSEDGIEEAVDAVSFQQVLESYGDFRATGAQQTAVANYERKYGLKDGKPKGTEPAQQPSPTSTDTNTPKGGAGSDNVSGAEPPAWAKEIIATNKKLAEQVATLQAEKVGTSRKARLTEVLKQAPESIRKRYDRDFERLNFKDDDDFTAWIEEITPEIAEIAKEVGSQGAVVSTPKGGSPAPASGKVNPAVQARIDERAASTTTSPIAGLQPNINK